MHDYQIYKNKGFTLIELLVAISIIATLTAILLPNFMGARERAKDSQKKQDMTAVKNALRLYYNDRQSYPPGIQVTGIGTTLGSYLPSASGIGYTYYYSQVNNGDGFQLCVPLEAATGEDVADSQMRCAITNTVCGAGITDSTSEKWFVVCAN